MKLETMLQLQKNLQFKLIKTDPKLGIPKEHILALIAETLEVLNELNWKPWKKPVPINRERLIFELVDVLMFYCNLLNSLEVTADEIELAYYDKLDIVKKREKEGY